MRNQVRETQHTFWVIAQYIPTHCRTFRHNPSHPCPTVHSQPHCIVLQCLASRRGVVRLRPQFADKRARVGEGSEHAQTEWQMRVPRRS